MNPEDIAKSFRRLKIHFPYYGDGFFYLLLREHDFDCCAALEALSSNQLTELLRQVPKDLDLLKAKKLLDAEDTNDPSPKTLPREKDASASESEPADLEQPDSDSGSDSGVPESEGSGSGVPESEGSGSGVPASKGSGLEGSGSEVSESRSLRSRKLKSSDIVDSSDRSSGFESRLSRSGASSSREQVIAPSFPSLFSNPKTRYQENSRPPSSSSSPELTVGRRRTRRVVDSIAPGESCSFERSPPPAPPSAQPSSPSSSERAVPAKLPASSPSVTSVVHPRSVSDASSFKSPAGATPDPLFSPSNASSGGCRSLMQEVRARHERRPIDLFELDDSPSPRSPDNSRPPQVPSFPLLPSRPSSSNEDDPANSLLDQNEPFIASLELYLNHEKSISPTILYPAEVLAEENKEELGRESGRESGRELLPSAPVPPSHGFRWVGGSRRYVRPGHDGSEDSWLLSGHLFGLGPRVYAELYAYQRLGVAWMFEVFKRQRGGVLGDEMGLGKTVQAVAFLRGLFSSDLATHCMVIVPLTLISQWVTHLKIWCPGAALAVFHGSRTERTEALNLCAKGSKPVVLLTTYETFRNAATHLHRAQFLPGRKLTKMEREAENDEGMLDRRWKARILQSLEEAESLGSKPWDVLILDEAHKIKNNSNQITKAVRQIKSKSRFLLTGTPVSNRLDEFWSLLDCANPGLLGNHLTFKINFADPIREGSARAAPALAVQRKIRATQELQRLVKPFVLRRTAATTLGQRKLNEAPRKSIEESSSRALPPKSDLIVWLDLTPEQTSLYEALLESRQVKKLFHDSLRFKRGVNSLKIIGLMQKICRHPVLVLPSRFLKNTSFIVDEEEITEIDFMSESEQQNKPEEWFRRAVELPQYSLEEMSIQSSKIIFLRRILPRLLSNDHRCLLFSGSVLMLDLIECLVMKPLSLSFLRVDGSVTNELRQSRIDQFKDDSQIFAMLMTTKVGGQGLNLISADRVIVVDPDWTPTNDNQAVARAHRIGQKRHVVIYRLIASGAVEDHAFRLQTFKHGLAKGTLEKAHQKSYFSREELQQIFTLRPTRGECKTQEILTNNSKDQNIKQILINDIGNDLYNLNQDVLAGIGDFGSLYHDEDLN